MSAPLRRTYRIAAGLAVDFRYDPSRPRPLEVQWEPDRPAQLRGAARRRYLEARAAFGRLLVDRLGRRLVLIETLDMPQEAVEHFELALCAPRGSA